MLVKIFSLSIKQRYLDLINHYAGGNKRRFSNMIGIGPTVLENIVGKRETKPSFDVLEKTLSTFVNLNARWLITGEGKFESNAENNHTVAGESMNALEMIKSLASENALLRREIEELRQSNGGYKIASEP